MQLSQRSIAGLMQHIAQNALRPQGKDVVAHHECVRSASATSFAFRSCQGLAAQSVLRLAQLSDRVILVVDEVDQLFRQQGIRTTAGSNGSLDILFSLHKLMGAPALAVLAIANAVDLLDRGTTPVTHGLCRMLLFKPYSADQLRSIAKARLAAAGESGAAAEQALGRVALELRVRQVAKRSGDCRPVVYMCEQALFQASLDREEASTRAEPNPTTPWPSTDQASEVSPEKLKRRRSDPSTNDPLSAIKQLPLEQQVLLCALVSANGEAVQFLDLCSSFKEMCKKLHQDTSLASKQAVNGALSALEQRGLLGLHRLNKRSAGRNRPASCPPNGSGNKNVVELAVSCAAVRQAVAMANPMLEKCLIGGA